MKTIKQTVKSQNPFRELHRQVPLTVKMIILTIIVSLSVWIVLDYILTNKLTNIFNAQLTEELNERARETKLGFDNYIKQFQNAPKLFVTQKRFSDYIEKQDWSLTDNVQIKYSGQYPAWFPARSVLPTIIQPRYAVLLDSGWNVREVNQNLNEQIPLPLLNPTEVMIQKSRDQTFVATFNGIPHITASQSYFNSKGELQATLIFASPIDHQFIYESLKYFSEEHLVALLTSGEAPRIITSCNLEELPIGTLVSTLQEHYFITETDLPDYEASGLQMKLASFISMTKIDNMTNSVISKARHERFVFALTLSLFFILIMYWITNRINKISWHIGYFSENFLGLTPGAKQSGDQLYALKEQFQKLTKEVMNARKATKIQAEEKTRLIVESAFDAIATTNNKGIISSWNPTAETLFGWTAEEAIGRPIYDLIVPQLHKEHKEPIKNLITKNKDRKSKSQLVLNTYHRNGHEIPVEFSVSSADQEKGSVLIFIMRDTTEHGRSEKRIHHLLATLTKAKDEWETTFDSVTEQIMLVDRDLNLIRCNKSFADSMRSTVYEIIGRKYDEFMLCDPEWLSGIKAGKEQSERIEIKTYDGHWLYVSTFPVYDKNDIFLYTIITATDITEMKKSQQNLLESKQELNDRVNELENFYDLAVNRELKMIKLKEQVQKLEVSNSGNADQIKIENPEETPNSAYIFNKKNINSSN